MRRRIVNRHKIERRFKRNIKRSRYFFNFLFGKKQEKSTKDFSWRGQTINPYKPLEKKDRGLQIKIGIIIGSLITVILLITYSPFFHLIKIDIEGLQRINETEIRNAVNGILGCKTLNLIPRKSYFVANTDEIRDVLKERFPIESIVVQKTFPNNITIVIEEKISTLIYDNGFDYSYVGLEGSIVEKMCKVGENEWEINTKITTSTNELGEIEAHEEVVDKRHIPDTKTVSRELGDYPIVYDKREKQLEINNRVLEENQVKIIIEWFNLFRKSTDIPLKYFKIEPEVGELTIFTYEGWYVKSRFDRKIQTQLEELLTLFKEKINRATVNYIDLRYKGRVYWQ